MRTNQEGESNQQAGLSPTDEIANLLVSEDEQEAPEAEEPVSEAEGENEDEQVTTEDSEEEETPSEESTDEEVTDESDPTWENVLGLDESQISLDDEGNLTGINVKVNGEVSTVKMNDLVAGYQNNKSFTQKSQALAEEKKQFETQVKTVAEEYKAKLDNAEALTTYLSKKLVSDYDGVDWDRLRAENPAEYAAARQDYASQAQELQKAQEALQQERSQLTQQQQAEFMKQEQQVLAEQRAKMLENNPEWNDPGKFEQDMTGMKNFLRNQYGFSDEDFASVRDARLIELVKDAKKFREGVKFAQKKITKPVPQFQKSSGKKAKAVSKLDKLTKAAKSAKGANKRHLQSDAIAELLIGGN